MSCPPDYEGNSILPFFMKEGEILRLKLAFSRIFLQLESFPPDEGSYACVY